MPKSLAELIACVDEIGPILAEEAATSEQQRRLSTRALAALKDSGLLWLKTPKELGGLEADNAVQFEVIGRLAFYSTAAAWCYFVYIDTIGRVLAYLGDTPAQALTKDGALPVICGGGGMMPGILEAVEGGY